MGPYVNRHSYGESLEVPPSSKSVKCFASSPNRVKYVECSSVKMTTGFFQRKREWNSESA